MNSIGQNFIVALRQRRRRETSSEDSAELDKGEFRPDSDHTVHEKDYGATEHLSVPEARFFGNTEACPTCHRYSRYCHANIGISIGTSKLASTNTAVQSRGRLPFHTKEFPPEEQRETIPPSVKMSRLRAPASLRPWAQGDRLSRLPVELKMELLECLTFDEGLALAATSWRMRMLEQDTRKLEWRKWQGIDLVSRLRGGDKYYGYQVCSQGCGQLLREDCFLSMATWDEEVATREAWGRDICLKVHDTCVECLQRAGQLDGLFFSEAQKLQQRLRSRRQEEEMEGLEEGDADGDADGQTDEQDHEPTYDQNSFLRRRCSCCCRAKVVRLRQWCEDCHTCRACRKDWQLEYDGFCETCADWRESALQTYHMAVFPCRLLPLDNEDWFPDVVFPRPAEEDERIAAQEMAELEQSIDETAAYMG